MCHLRLVYSAPAPRASGFNALDLIALAHWAALSEQHGYARVHVEDGDGTTGPENADYALVYELGQDWASWGLAREGDRISIWHCGTGADMCSFPEMEQALESLPRVGFSTPTAFRGRARERVAAAPARPRLILVHQS